MKERPVEAEGSWKSDIVTKYTPMKDENRPSSFLPVNSSMPTRAPIAMVKKEEVEDRIVCEATLVYAKELLVKKFAKNHRIANRKVSSISLPLLFVAGSCRIVPYVCFSIRQDSSSQSLGL